MKPDWLDDFKLDDEAGPAPPLETSKAALFATAVVDQALPTGGGSGGLLRRTKTFLVIASVSSALAVMALSYREHVTDTGCPAGPCGEGALPKVVEAPVPPAPSAAHAEPAPIETVPIAALPNVTEPAPVARPSTPTATPADLLAEANRARRDHEWARAAQLYERVMGTRADEAYAATVALASLRLEHEGDPRGALALYEHALAMRPEGVLSAQARAGVARCRRTLGESP